MRSNQILSVLGIAAAGFVSLNCASDPSEPPPVKTPTTVTASGNSQTGTVGAALASQIGVTILDQNGDAMSGVVVTFAVTAGGGSITPLTAASNASGVATTTWTLGTVAGVNNNTASISVPDYGGPAMGFMASATAGPAAVLAIADGNGQSAMVGTALPLQLAASVKDSYGNSVAGATVMWAVTGGGGWVSSATATTSAAGTAAVTRTLGATVGGQTTTASVVGTAPASVVFNATGTPVSSQYNIEIRPLTAMSPTQTAAFASASARWSGIITGDLPPSLLVADPGDCFANSPAQNETIDDIVIFATVDSIDGPLGILGGASPCWIRGAGSLTIVGGMVFDSADMALLESNGILEAVILHEMGHVIGIGSLWTFITPSLLTGGGTADPYFNGANGVFQFGLDGGAVYAGVPVPVENSGGTGTRDSHGRESVMGRELMTGYVSLTSNPLSTITIGSLADMAYVVSYANADPYTVSSVNLRAGEGGRDLHLVEMRPDVRIKSVDPFGRITRVR